jgi:hypothetical protein
MSGGAVKLPVIKAEANALEPYRRLIELQKEIMELVERNSEAERQCAVLREQLAREADALLWSRRAARFRLRISAIGLLQRIFGRASSSREMEAPISVRTSKRASESWACALGHPQAARE